MKNLIIGIDPGSAGGIAVIDATDGHVRQVDNMPSTDAYADIYEYLAAIADEAKGCILEDVGHGMPGQSSSATAKFARHNGHLEMALYALKIPTVKVTPQKWQKVYQLGKSTQHSKTEWKNKLKAKAQQLFPELGKRVTLKTADALLLARYGWQETKW